MTKNLSNHPMFVIEKLNFSFIKYLRLLLLAGNDVLYQMDTLPIWSRDAVFHISPNVFGCDFSKWCGTYCTDTLPFCRNPAIVSSCLCDEIAKMKKSSASRNQFYALEFLKVGLLKIERHMYSHDAQRFGTTTNLCLMKKVWWSLNIWTKNPTGSFSQCTVCEASFIAVLVAVFCYSFAVSLQYSE